MPAIETLPSGKLRVRGGKKEKAEGARATDVAQIRNKLRAATSLRAVAVELEALIDLVEKLLDAQ